MGSFFSKQVQRRKSIHTQKKLLYDLKVKNNTNFPGSDYHSDDRKNWMSTLVLEKLNINKIIWPGTHDSATNKIGIPFISRPFARTQSLSIYKQLVTLNRVINLFEFYFILWSTFFIYLIIIFLTGNGHPSS